MSIDPGKLEDLEKFATHKPGSKILTLERFPRIEFF
jgi:hypothetical protein